ncbi:MAG: hypothetical protein JRJ49_01045 [Deltaproteobacteria bacterium]|nr:hypothetical protein [Deltaproteobacteria bacterium]
MLAFICAIIGDIIFFTGKKINGKYIKKMTTEMNQKEKLSFRAYQEGDKAGYKALNKEATEAWGKNFFTMAAYSAGMLAPIPFALGWMDTRFSEVKFLLAYPFSLIFGDAVGYTFTFIPIYILSRIIFKYIRLYIFKKD